MTTSEQLRAAIEAKAKETGFSPSTIGEKAGQGGQFYSRLCDGKRVWPETAKSVLDRLALIEPTHPIEREGAAA